jgi:hypothetical protein
MSVGTRAPAPALAATAAAATVLLLGGCGSKESPEERVRAVITKAEEGAEARDLSAVMDLVSDRYADTRGQDKQSIRALLHGYFVINQSVHLLVRIEDLEFPADETAQARVTVGMLGRQAQEDWSFAAEAYEFDVRLALEDGEWLLTSAEWRRP